MHMNTVREELSLPVVAHDWSNAPHGQTARLDKYYCKHSWLVNVNLNKKVILTAINITITTNFTVVKCKIKVLFIAILTKCWSNSAALQTGTANL